MQIWNSRNCFKLHDTFRRNIFLSLLPDRRHFVTWQRAFCDKPPHPSSIDSNQPATVIQRQLVCKTHSCRTNDVLSVFSTRRICNRKSRFSVPAEHDREAKPWLLRISDTHSHGYEMKMNSKQALEWQNTSLIN